MDFGAFSLFAIITAWQMPHFYAIALYRMEEYKQAGVPVLPLIKGLKNTKVQMNLFCALFLLTSLTPYLLGHVGKLYLVTQTLLGSIWLYFASKGFNTSCDIKWAKTMFRLSLIIIMVFSIMVTMDRL